MKYIIAAITLLLLTAMSCKKDNNNQLPPETATGANTFGCKVNGAIYTPSGGDATIGLYPVQGSRYQDVDGNVGLFIQTVSANTKYINLYIKKLNGVGIYNLNFNTDPFAVRSENYAFYSTKDNMGNH